MTLREVTLSGVFVAVGLAIPMLFHMVGLGAAFLPMFLPILAVGLLQPPLPAALVGLTTPVVSALLTGMPPLMPPIAVAMAFEGATLGALSSLLYRRLEWNIYLAAAMAVLAERLVMVMATMLWAPWFGLPGRLAAVGMLAQGLPGVGLLVLAVPSLVRKLKIGCRRQNGTERAYA